MLTLIRLDKNSSTFYLSAAFTVTSQQDPTLSHLNPVRILTQYSYNTIILPIHAQISTSDLSPSVPAYRSRIRFLTVAHHSTGYRHCCCRVLVYHMVPFVHYSLFFLFFHKFSYLPALQFPTTVKI
jgi:hypothetical protein